MVNRQKLPDALCPFCGYRANAAAQVNCPDKKMLPRPGDLTLCLCCAEVSIFRDDLRPRKIMPEEMAELSPANLDVINQYKAAHALVVTPERQKEMLERNDGGHA